MTDRLSALLARARAHLGAGRIAAAEADLSAVLAHDPEAAEARALLGTAALARGDPVAAERWLVEALARTPDAAWARSNLGLVLQARGRLADAIAAFRAALESDPSFADAAFNLGAALDDARDRAGAIAAYRQALAADPQHSGALNNLALKEAEDGRQGDALALYQRALAAAPGDPGVLCNLGNALAHLGRAREAEDAFRRALARAPNSPGTLSDYGAFLHRQGRAGEALTALRRAAADRNAPAAAPFNLGLALENAGRIEEALAAYGRAAERDPHLTAARINQAEALRRLGRLGEARGAIDAARATAPNDGRVLATAMSLALYTCDWRAVESLAPALDAATRAALGTAALGETPSLAMRWREDPAIQFEIGRTWCDIIARAFPPMARAPNRTAGRSRRIVLGYLTHDARAHAGGYMVCRLFANHDRDRFEVRVYATCADDGSAVRAEIAAGCDAFIDVRTLSHAETAARIRADNVDILIDLNGWSEGGRLETAALRPAPIQATYVGFPGTTGASFFDYAIVDEIIAPPEHAAFFSETLARLPHSYQINDGPHLISGNEDEAARCGARRDAGLPEDAVVFASFNQAFKIEPVGFAAWMAILGAVPGSVLWLLDDNPLASDALRHQASARGIDPARLIFAPRRPRDAHLIRVARADCALDTRVCNGHTTTTDALAVGVPVITGLGQTFAGRVSASLLRAAGLSELVTRDIAEYVALAVRIGRDPAMRIGLRDRVRANAARWPLLDTARTVRNLERTYLAMREAHLAGRRPTPLRIDDPEPPAP